MNDFGKSGSQYSGAALLFSAALAAGSCTDTSALDASIVGENAQDIPELLATYSKSWAEQDVDAILNLHSEDSLFRIEVDGTQPAKGKAELRMVLEAIFESNPNYSSTPRAVRVGDNFAVVEYDMHIDPTRPNQIGNFNYVPVGEPYSIPTIDVIEFENGLVVEKITYLDMETARANSSSVDPIE